MTNPIKPIEVTEQIPVAVPVPSVPRPELFVVESWCEIDKAWSGTIARTPDRAQYLAGLWKSAHIFRIPGEAEMKEKAAKEAGFLAACESAAELISDVELWLHNAVQEKFFQHSSAQSASALCDSMRSELKLLRTAIANATGGAA